MCSAEYGDTNAPRTGRVLKIVMNKPLHVFNTFALNDFVIFKGQIVRLDYFFLSVWYRFQTVLMII